MVKTDYVSVIQFYSINENLHNTYNLSQAMTFMHGCVIMGSVQKEMIREEDRERRYGTQGTGIFSGNHQGREHFESIEGTAYNTARPDAQPSEPGKGIRQAADRPGI